MTDETPLEQLPAKERRSVYVQVTALLIVPAALVILLVVASAVGVAWYDGRERAEANREHIERIGRTEARQKQQERADAERQRRALKLVAASDLRRCREIEKIKTLIRETVRFDPVAFRETLSDLGVDADSPRGQRLERQQRERAAEISDRFAKSSCAVELPSS